MAKKIKIGLAMYALNNDYGSEVRCKGCGFIFKYPHRAYSAVRYDAPEDYYCLNCINKLKINFIEQIKQKAFVYPVQKKLYVGSNHQCGEKITDFIYCLAYFMVGNSGRLLPLRKCKKCGEYFIILNDAKKHDKFLQKYILINPQTQKQIYIPYVTKEMFSPHACSNTRKPAEATPQEQWAAKHPYQGGGFSGK
jgi:hypothetical protein